jgi:hypothetical protein
MPLRKNSNGEDGRGKNPNSLANLKPTIPGEVRNPEGKNGAFRPFTTAISKLSVAPLPEHLRVAMNSRFRSQLFPALKGVMPSVRRLQDIPDFYFEGITWAEANALRQGLSAIVEGNVSSAVELRESVEGCATTRVEFVSQQDKLEALLNAFRNAARPIDVKAVLPAGNTDGGNGAGNTAGNTSE